MVTTNSLFKRTIRCVALKIYSQIVRVYIELYERGQSFHSSKQAANKHQSYLYFMVLHNISIFTLQAFWIILLMKLRDVDIAVLSSYLLLVFILASWSVVAFWDHPFSTYVTFSKKRIFLTSWYAHVRPLSSGWFFQIEKLFYSIFTKNPMGKAGIFTFSS